MRRRGRGRPVDVRRRGDPERDATARRHRRARRRPTRTWASGSPSPAPRRRRRRIGRSRRARRRRRGGPWAGAFSRQPPASRARAAIVQAPSGIRSDDRLVVGGGQIASSVSIRAWPRRTAGWRTSQRRNRRFVVRPRTTVSSSAAVRRPERLGAVGAVGDDLGQHRVEPAGRPRRRRRSRRRRGSRRRPASGAPRPGRSPAGTRPPRPRRRGGPRSRGRRRPRSSACAEAASGSPAAIRSWSATRSRPVTSLRDGMLDLEPGVHLEEEELAAVVEEELARPGALVADRARRAAGRPRSGGDGPRADGGRRRLLEDLLVAPLERAVALAEVDAVAVPSNRTWTSTWRGPSTSRSRISRSSPNAACASRRAAASCVAAARRASRTVRMPLPPPPAAGLTRSGSRSGRAARPSAASAWSSPS